MLSVVEAEGSNFYIVMLSVVMLKVVALCMEHLTILFVYATVLALKY
jgi:hypothetical protein